MTERTIIKGDTILKDEFSASAGDVNKIMLKIPNMTSTATLTFQSLRIYFNADFTSTRAKGASDNNEDTTLFMTIGETVSNQSLINGFTPVPFQSLEFEHDGETYVLIKYVGDDVKMINAELHYESLGLNADGLEIWVKNGATFCLRKSTDVVASSSGGEIVAYACTLTPTITSFTAITAMTDLEDPFITDPHDVLAPGGSPTNAHLSFADSTGREVISVTHADHDYQNIFNTPASQFEPILDITADTRFQYIESIDSATMPPTINRSTTTITEIVKDLQRTESASDALKTQLNAINQTSPSITNDFTKIVNLTQAGNPFPIVVSDATPDKWLKSITVYKYHADNNSYHCYALYTPSLRYVSGPESAYDMGVQISEFGVEIDDDEDYYVYDDNLRATAAEQLDEDYLTVFSGYNGRIYYAYNQMDMPYWLTSKLIGDTDETFYTMISTLDYTGFLMFSSKGRIYKLTRTPSTAQVEASLDGSIIATLPAYTGTNAKLDHSNVCYVLMPMHISGTTKYMFSYDGINWEEKNLPTSANGYTVNTFTCDRTTNAFFIGASGAMGLSGGGYNVLYSFDGINWTGYDTSMFTEGMEVYAANDLTVLHYKTDSGTKNWWSIAAGTYFDVYGNRITDLSSHSSTTIDSSLIYFYATNMFAHILGTASGSSTPTLTAYKFNAADKLIKVQNDMNIKGVLVSDVKSTVTTHTSQLSELTTDVIPQINDNLDHLNTIFEYPIQWVGTGIPQDTDAHYFQSVAAGNDKFISINCNPDAAVKTYVYSSDGITWTSAELPVTGKWRRVVFANNVFYALRTEGTYYWSADGITWTVQRSPTFSPLSEGRIWDIIEGKLISVAFPLESSSTTGDRWYYSTEISEASRYWNWGRSAPGVAATYTPHAVAYGNGKFVAVHETNTPPCLNLVETTSPTVWTGVTLPTVTDGSVEKKAYGSAIAFYKNYFITIDTRTTAAVSELTTDRYGLFSSDGDTWHPFKLHFNAGESHLYNVVFITSTSYGLFFTSQNCNVVTFVSYATWYDFVKKYSYDGTGNVPELMHVEQTLPSSISWGNVAEHEKGTLVITGATSDSTVTPNCAYYNPTSSYITASNVLPDNETRLQAVEAKVAFPVGSVYQFASTGTPTLPGAIASLGTWIEINYITYTVSGTNYDVKTWMRTA